MFRFPASGWQYFAGLVRIQGTTGLVQVLGSLTFFAIGVLVFLLRPGNRAAHALLLIGVSFFFNAWPVNPSVPTLFYRLPPPSIPLDTWTGAINPSLMYLVLVFPRPKWPASRFPRLTVTLLYLPWIAVFNLLYLLNLNNPEGYIQAAFTVYPVQVILLLVVTLASLVHSGITVRDPVGRSQFKWMLVGIGGFVFVGVGGWLVTSYLLNGLELSWLVTVTGWFLLPICLAIAITRYRLFDIDVLIRKTLLYAVLTAMLALVYFGSVVLVGELTRSLTGENSNIAVVVSTLTIAALFGPLRRRVQATIDQRFYRRTYNAAQNIAAFGVSAQNEVDMEKLTGELLYLVNETMQPASVSLWLRDR